MSKIFPLLLISSLIIASCGRGNESPVQPPQTAFDVSVQPLDNVDLQPATPPYLNQVTYQPEAAKYFDLATAAIPLNEDERSLLGENGFVVTDRYAWRRFIEAYAWIYWQDLPVLVTTDSILHTVHQSYSDLLQSLEWGILIPEMEKFLRETQAAVDQAANGNSSDELTPLYADVQVYLETAQSLLNGWKPASTAASDFVALAQSANAVEEVTFAGTKRSIDFSIFQPRGHYNNDETLQQYFRAMSWLAQMDFRFVEYDMVTSEATVNPNQIAAATILEQAIDSAEQRLRLDTVNQLFEALIGPSDNMTLPDLNRFQTDMSLTDPAAFLAQDEAALLTQLTTNDYGQQRITGQIVHRHIANTSPESIPRPVTFALLGQRFGIDSYILGNLIYDRLMIDGKPVERALPLPLDLMAGLGNDRALTHIQPELATYQYGGHLAALRQTVDELDETFWQAPVYNQWLGMIRSLNTATVDNGYPQSMQTAAWADKMLQTQLSSWAQLRHDNILYIKQSYTTVQVMCEYPAGYVEPYPEFYAGLYNFAANGQAALMALDLGMLNAATRDTQSRAFDYFGNVMIIADQLRTLAEKELRLEEFTPEEETWLRSLMVKQEPNVEGCGGPRFEDMWDGWYRNLFFEKDETPALIADVHTNPTDDPRSALFPPRVLHAATGEAVPALFIVDTDEGEALYVGPTFSYFEQITQGDKGKPAARLTDEQWREQIATEGNPPAPAWTESFRVSIDGKPTFLLLPRE